MVLPLLTNIYFADFGSGEFPATLAVYKRQLSKSPPCGYTQASYRGVCMKENVEAIIFDLDGTIVTTEAAWDHAARTFLARYGIYSDEFEQRIKSYEGQLLGVTPKEWSNALKRMFSISMHEDEMFDSIRNELFTTHVDKITFIDGFSAFIAKLQAKQFKRAIATNSDDESVNKIKSHVPLDYFFESHIYTISCVSNPKPHPDLYLHAARLLGVHPSNCIVIEDSAVGIAAAKAAGMYCIGITSAGNPALLREADEIIDSYDEIVL